MVSVSRKIFFVIISGFIFLFSTWGFSQTAILTSNSPRPSLKKVFIQSLLIPGWGEIELGNHKRGKIFILSELGLWVALVQTQYFAKFSDTQFKTIAAKHAGVDLHNKSALFFVDIENYMSMDIYNETQQRLRHPEKVYPKGIGYEWNWDSESQRKKFKQYRIKKDLVKKIGRFMIGGIVLNHIISGIDVTYLFRISQAQQKSVIPFVYVGQDKIIFTFSLKF